MKEPTDRYSDAMGRPAASTNGLQRRRPRISLCAFVVLILLVTVLSTPDSQAVQMVGNTSVPDLTMKRPTAWAIFSMRLRTWSDGSPATVFVFSDIVPLHAEFTKKILNTFPYQLRRAWDRLVFSGTGQAPTEVESIDEMYKRILSTPGSVGYLPDDRVDTRVRVLKVE
jgi:hypothetical protein